MKTKGVLISGALLLVAGVLYLISREYESWNIRTSGAVHLDTRNESIQPAGLESVEAKFDVRPDGPHVDCLVHIFDGDVELGSNISSFENVDDGFWQTITLEVNLDSGSPVDADSMKAECENR